MTLRMRVKLEPLVNLGAVVVARITIGSWGAFYVLATPWFAWMFGRGKAKR